MRGDIVYPDVDRDRVLRELDPFEEHFWLMEYLVRRGHVLATEIWGPTNIEKWQHALQELQQIYPLLQASIGKSLGERPFFYTVPERHVPLRVQQLTPSFSMNAAIEDELSEPFLDGESLTRAKLFHSDERCVLFLASHHASMDGKSHLFLLSDLLSLLTGGTTQPSQPLAPSVSSLFRRKSSAYLPTSDTLDLSDRETLVNSSPPLHIARLELSITETENLVSKAKTKGVSVHSSVLAALALAGLRTSTPWQMDGIRCLSPVDVRSIHKLDNEVGQLITLHPNFLKGLRENQIWEIAKKITASMRSTRLRDSIEDFLNKASSLVQCESSPQAYSRSLRKSAFVHDLMLTSYGSYQVRTDFDYLRLGQVFTAGFAGGPETQKFSTITVNGSLGITHVAHHPFPQMLESAKMILENAISTGS